MTDHLLSESRVLGLSVQGGNKLFPGGRCLAMSRRTLVFGTVFCESRERWDLFRIKGSHIHSWGSQALK